MRSGPLADSYPGAVALVVLALVPFLLLTAAVLPLATPVARSVGLSTHAFDVTLALSDGAYAFGTVLAVQFATRFRPRRMLLVYASVFVMASVCTAVAPIGEVFSPALVAQGLCTSLMLIAAVPPLVSRWPAAKMPFTATVMNMCIFGAVAVGPSVGALQASAGGWRPVFWGVAALGAFALAFAWLTFEDDAPADPGAPWDIVAIALAAGSCGAGFFGAGELQATGVGVASLAPLCSGAALVIVLVVYEFRIRRPLMPMRQIATALPVTGILIALFASAAGFGLMVLLLGALKTKATAAHTAWLFLPEFGAAVLVAGVFGILFRTRFTPVLAFSGMLAIGAAAAIGLGVLADPGGGWTAVVTALIGLGVAAAVSPALFLAGLSLRSSQIQRVFALIELLRGVTAFLVAPVRLPRHGALERQGGRAPRGPVGLPRACCRRGRARGRRLRLEPGPPPDPGPRALAGRRAAGVGLTACLLQDSVTAADGRRRPTCPVPPRSRRSRWIRGRAERR